MWLASLKIGLKRIFLLIVIAIVIIFVANQIYPPLALVTDAYLVLFILILLHATLFYGVYIRRKVFLVNHVEHELRDFILPIKPSENLRGIYVVKSGVISSRLYLNQNNHWAYFDKLREFLEQHKNIPLQKFLLLGGGGGTVAVTLARQYPKTQIDVVEISAPMTRLAKRYFLSRLKNQKSISWHTESAQKFLSRTNQKYNLIFVDIFEGDVTPSFIGNSSFLAHLKNCLASNGVLVINLGVKARGDMSPLLKNLMKIFKTIQLYWWGKNLVAVWHAAKRKND